MTNFQVRKKSSALNFAHTAARGGKFEMNNRWLTIIDFALSFIENDQIQLMTWQKSIQFWWTSSAKKGHLDLTMAFFLLFGNVYFKFYI